MTSEVTPTPGWYDDGSGNKRWWDGQQWGPYAPAPAVVLNVTPLVERRPLNGAAVGGMILGILSLLLFWVPGLGLILAVLGIIFSSVGLWLVRQRGSGHGMAAAGLILSVVTVAIYLLIFLISITHAATA